MNLSRAGCISSRDNLRPFRQSFRCKSRFRWLCWHTAPGRLELQPRRLSQPARRRTPLATQPLVALNNRTMPSDPAAATALPSGSERNGIDGRIGYSDARDFANALLLVIVQLLLFLGFAGAWDFAHDVAESLGHVVGVIVTADQQFAGAIQAAAAGDAFAVGAESHAENAPVIGNRSAMNWASSPISRFTSRKIR